MFAFLHYESMVIHINGKLLPRSFESAEHRSVLKNNQNTYACFILTPKQVRNSLKTL